MNKYESIAVNVLILSSIAFLTWGGAQFIKEILDILL